MVKIYTSLIVFKETLYKDSDLHWFFISNLYKVTSLYKFTSFKELFKESIYKDSDLYQFLYQIYTRFVYWFYLGDSF